MTEEKQTALQRWGSNPTPARTAVAIIVFVSVLGLMVGLGVYFATRVTDDRLEREQVLDDRYVEKIEIGVVNTAGQPEVIQIDGKPRDDCEDTDDGYLECADDPQPTLEPSAR